MKTHTNINEPLPSIGVGGGGGTWNGIATGGNGKIAIPYSKVSTGGNYYNATFFDAAPDMLAALKGILPYCMKESEPEPGPEYAHYHVSKAVRAAIAKAEGKL